MLTRRGILCSWGWWPQRPTHLREHSQCCPAYSKAVVRSYHMLHSYQSVRSYRMFWNSSGTGSTSTILCHKETQWLGMYRQSETRAGKHRRHTRTRKASLPTQAKNTARGARKQPPNQGAIHAASEDTTHTSTHRETK